MHFLSHPPFLPTKRGVFRFQASKAHQKPLPTPLASAPTLPILESSCRGFVPSLPSGRIRRKAASLALTALEFDHATWSVINPERECCSRSGAAFPIVEPCARIGSADYDARSAVECRVFQRMLERLFPVPDEADPFLLVRQFLHEFGMYREVCVKHRGHDGRAYATRVENELRQHWDETAAAELRWYEKKLAFQQAVSANSLSLDDVPQPYRGIHPPENVVELERHQPPILRVA